jgi:hypothetical protein
MITDITSLLLNQGSRKDTITLKQTGIRQKHALRTQYIGAISAETSSTEAMRLSVSYDFTRSPR